MSVELKAGIYVLARNIAFAAVATFLVLVVGLNLARVFNGMPKPVYPKAMIQPLLQEPTPAVAALPRIKPVPTATLPALKPVVAVKTKPKKVVRHRPTQAARKVVVAFRFPEIHGG